MSLLTFKQSNRYSRCSWALIRLLNSGRNGIYAVICVNYLGTIILPTQHYTAFSCKSIVSLAYKKRSDFAKHLRSIAADA